MSRVEEGSEGPAAPLNDPGNMWDVQSPGNTNRRHMFAAGAVLGASALALGLFFGIQENTQGGQNIITGQADPSSEGCFIDNEKSPVMESIREGSVMTSENCDEHCGTENFTFYGMKGGTQCGCATGNTDFSQLSVGTCNIECGGEEGVICGGSDAYTVYKVGVNATTPENANASLSMEPLTTTDCDGPPASIRYVDSKQQVIFGGGGCATLTGLYNSQIGDSGPLFVLDSDDEIIVGATNITGRWLLDRNMEVKEGAILSVHGRSIGGDADVLRIKSTSSEFFSLRGVGGSLSFRSTKVTSWDPTNLAVVDWEESIVGRSYISCITQFDDSGKWDCKANKVSEKAEGQCRMDVIDSEIGDLGFFDAESYGISWKVRGMCNDIDEVTGLPTNHQIFETHNVFGDIINSNLHGMYYGMYSYGLEGSRMINNTMHDNILYGFDPHDDSDNLVIAYNRVWGNGNHGIIASKRCNNVSIHHNEVWGGGPEAAGIFLHRSSDDALVHDNYVHDMQDAGMAMMESFGADVRNNVFENCRFGIRFSVGCANNLIENNEFSSMSQYGIYTYQGSDLPAVNDSPDADGRPKNNVFNKNVISNVTIGVHINEGDNNEFTENVFTAVQRFNVEDGVGNLFMNNTVFTACLEAGTGAALGNIPRCDGEADSGEEDDDLGGSEE